MVSGPIKNAAATSLMVKAPAPGLLGFHIDNGAVFFGRRYLFRPAEDFVGMQRPMSNPNASTDPAVIAAYYDRLLAGVKQAPSSPIMDNQINLAFENLSTAGPPRFSDAILFRGIENPVQSEWTPSNRSPIRAAVHSIIEPGLAFVFAGPNCVEIQTQTAGLKDRLFLGPFSIQLMEEAKISGFHAFDAVLDLYGDRRKVRFVFNGNRCAWVLYDAWSVTMSEFGPPQEITVVWKSLREAGFSTLDAVIPSPEGAWHFYIFRGSEYVYIKVHDDMRDERISGPKSIWDNWPSIKATGFTTIDAALRSPEHVEDGHTYIFSGENYALISIFPGTSNDRLLRGPRPVVVDWPSLAKAGFY